MDSSTATAAISSRSCSRRLCFRLGGVLHLITSRIAKRFIQLRVSPEPRSKVSTFPEFGVLSYPVLRLDVDSLRRPRLFAHRVHLNARLNRGSKEIGHGTRQRRSARRDQRCAVDARVERITITEVKGFGSPNRHTEVYRGAEYHGGVRAEGADRGARRDDEARRVPDAIVEAASCPAVATVSLALTRRRDHPCPDRRVVSRRHLAARKQLLSDEKPVMVSLSAGVCRARRPMAFFELLVDEAGVALVVDRRLRPRRGARARHRTRRVLLHRVSARRRESRGAVWYPIWEAGCARPQFQHARRGTRGGDRDLEPRSGFLDARTSRGRCEARGKLPPTALQEASAASPPQRQLACAPRRQGTRARRRPARETPAWGRRCLSARTPSQREYAACATSTRCSRWPSRSTLFTARRRRGGGAAMFCSRRASHFTAIPASLLSLLPAGAGRSGPRARPADAARSCSTSRPRHGRSAWP